LWSRRCGGLSCPSSGRYEPIDIPSELGLTGYQDRFWGQQFGLCCTSDLSDDRLADALDAYTLNQQRIWRSRIRVFAQAWLPLLFGCTTKVTTSENPASLTQTTNPKEIRKSNRLKLSNRLLRAAWGNSWRNRYAFLLAADAAASFAKNKMFDTSNTCAFDTSVAFAVLVNEITVADDDAAVADDVGGDIAVDVALEMEDGVWLDGAPETLVPGAQTYNVSEDEDDREGYGGEGDDGEGDGDGVKNKESDQEPDF
jgi:hypothetical protein